MCRGNICHCIMVRYNILGVAFNILYATPSSEKFCELLENIFILNLNEYLRFMCEHVERLTDCMFCTLYEFRTRVFIQVGLVC